MTDDTEALLNIFNRQDHGPSPWGLSTHGGWVGCGKKASLKQRDKDLIDAGLQEAPVADGEKLKYLHVGLHTHKLFEGRLLRKLGTDLLWDARGAVFDINFLEAVRLFRAYHNHWGSIEERWGAEILAAEYGLGEGQVAESIIKKLGGPLTGRADAIINVRDPAKVFANTGHHLLPGRYILDYKTSKMITAKDGEKFGPDNLQAQAYLWLDTMKHGEEGALGCIFERLIGHQVITKEKSYASYVVYPQMDSEERLRALVQLSMASQANPRPNPLSCTGFYGDVCWYKRSGQCQGY